MTATPPPVGEGRVTVIDPLEERLDPEVAAALAAVPAMDLTAETLAQWRSFPPPDLDISGTVTRTNHVVRGEHTAPDVGVYVYRPSVAEVLLPCLYWMHGGGYVVGSGLGDAARFERWCRLGCVVVSVEYRLAPEHPFPGPLDDCYAGLLWVAAQADELAIDPARLGVGGASAGGGLAAALALLARDRCEVDLAFQLLNSPMLDDRQVTPSSQRDAVAWTPRSNRYAWASYLADLDGTDAVPPYAAPARAADLAGLPPALVTVGSVDGFFDEDVAYAERLNRAGVPTELHVYPGAPHGFELIAPASALARRSVHDTDDWLRRQFQRPA